MTAAELLQRLEGVRQAAGGHVARCPSHEDRQASLSVAERDGRVLVRCFAGCTTQQIADGAGVKVSDLFLAERPRAGGSGITLVELAADKQIPAAFLRELGCGEEGGAVIIPYRDAEGRTVRRRRRRALTAKLGSTWESGAEMLPYGLERLARARAAGRLILVEGESDCWTLWHQGFAALGLPGATQAKLLRAEHLEGFTHVYVSRETDQGGPTFVAGIRAQLRELRFPGALHELRMPGGHKDPNDLHRADRGAFGHALETALADAPEIPLEREPGEDDESPPDDYPLAAEAAIADWAQPLPPARSSGFPELDQALGGGLRAEGVYVLAGGTGKGKTGMALQIATHVARTTPTLYLSSELSRRQINARLAAPRLNTPWREIYDWGPTEGPRIAESVGGLQLRPIELQRDMSVEGLLGEVRPPFVVLDYLQHAARRLMPEDRRLATGALLDELTRYAREHKATVLVLSAVGRGHYVGGQEKSADELVGASKESGDIEYDAAAVLVLEAHAGESDARLHVAKSRFGGDGTVLGFRWHRAIGTFSPDAGALLTEDQRAIIGAVRVGVTTSNAIAENLQRRKDDVLRDVRMLLSRGVLMRVRDNGPLMICEMDYERDGVNGAS